MSDIFISYSHADAEYLEELKTFLAPLKERIKAWDDEQIEVGDEWQAEITSALDKARIGLLLVSPNFLASNYIMQHEVPRLVQAAEDRKLKLVVLYLKTSAVQDEGSAVTIVRDGSEQRVSLTKYQGLNSPQQPIGDLKKEGTEEERNQVYLRVSQKLAKLAKFVAKPKSNFRNAGDLPDELREPLSNALPATVTLGQLLARGKRSIVYEGYDDTLQRPVAIKVVDPTKVDAHAFERCLSTVRVAARLNHRGIMSVYQSIHHERLLYTEMQHVDGMTLRELANWGAQPMHKVLRLLERFADMLDYAHRRGFVHGAIHPAHVLVDHDGWPMISPFKLASTSPCDNFSGDYVALESLKYASPEQYEGTGDTTAASDQYALGLIIYELVTGTQTIDAKRLPDIISRKNAMVRRPATLAIDALECPPALRDAMARMLKRNPAARWPSMREVIQQFAIARSQLRSELSPRLRKPHTEAYASFERLRGDKGFFEGFYGRFLPKLDDEVRKQFPMDMEKQYRMLREALELMLLNPVEPDNAALRKLAEVHGRYDGFGLKASDYDQFMVSLVATVKDHEGEARGELIAECWEKAMAPGIAFMKRHICSGPAPVGDEAAVATDNEHRGSKRAAPRRSLVAAPSTPCVDNAGSVISLSEPPSSVSPRLPPLSPPVVAH